MQPGPGWPPPGTGQPRRRFVLPVILGIVVALILAAGAFLVLDGGGDSDELVLEPLDPASYTAPDSFFENLDMALNVDEAAAAEVASGITDSLSSLGTPTEGTESARPTGTEPAGNEPGLYGGSRNDQICNIEDLTSFLIDPANADKTQAWADTLGIGTSEEEITGYLDRLTPVRLTFDTRVTNHGFDGSEATPFQSVLQAGTAVLVDDLGIPRVKCNCGNPLVEPEGEAVNVESASNYDEAAWESLDPEQVISVTPAEEALEDIVMVNIDDGTLLERPVGSRGEADKGTGDFQATLEWEHADDLDLSVTDPSGIEIWYSDTAPAGTEGQLDLDANAPCGSDMPAPVENIYWDSGGAPPGEYTVEVTGFDLDGSDCAGDGSYTLTISVFGQEDQVYTGTVTEDSSETYTVTVE